MTQKWINYLQLGIIIILGWLLTTRGCSKNTPTSYDVQNTPPKIEYKYISSIDSFPKYIPKWKTRIDTFPYHDTIPIDTNLILKDYFTKYYYEDTLKLDTFGLVILKDTVSLNKITSRKYNYNLNIPEIIITKETFLNPKEYYLGVNIIGSPSQLNFIGADVLYRGTTNKIYGLGVGLNNNLQPMISGKIYWKLK